MKTFVLCMFIFCSSIGFANMNGVPYCSGKQTNKKLVIGYLGADSSWKLKDTNLSKLEEQLSHITLVNYSFIRLGKDDNGNTVLKPSAQDIENIQTIRQLKPKLPIMIAVGGWGDRDGFKTFLENEEQMMVFVNSVKNMLDSYQLDGIDVDWENELLASKEEELGVAKLMQRLYEHLNRDGYCLSNAVPGTQAYWKQYPDAKLWQAYVNWTTIMSYDNYGTFGPRTEHAAALYDTSRQEDTSYPYPTTSGNEAVQHYYQQGLESQKIILGLPFYCHSYYIKNEFITANSQKPGLYAPIIDANINSQISYNEAYNTYGVQLTAYKDKESAGGYNAVSNYGIIPLEGTNLSRFMSCDSPQSVLDKIAYVEGANPISTKEQKQITLGGVSFWSLQQDLEFSHPDSLLRAIAVNMRSS